VVQFLRYITSIFKQGLKLFVLFLTPRQAQCHSGLDGTLRITVPVAEGGTCYRYSSSCMCM